MRGRISGAALAGAAALLALPGAVAAEDVAYTVGGEAFTGYFARATEPKGLVVIVHDWDGLGEYERRRADMLAALGYDAFALDVYGAGNRPETTEARIAATRAAFADPARLQAMVEGGLAEARALSDAEGLVLTGYCFGGTVTMAAARAGTEGIAGYASFHGNFPDGPAWPTDTPPILVMHGAIDQNPDMATLAGFIAEAEAAGLEYDVEIYAGADHAFTVFDGARYQERADARSWDAFQRFLAEHLDATAG